MEGNSPFLGGRKKENGRLSKKQQADIGGSALTLCDLPESLPLWEPLWYLLQWRQEGRGLISRPSIKFTECQFCFSICG